MTFWDYVYTGIPVGIESTASLLLLVINVIAPGVGTIISAFLSSHCENETVVVGVLQVLTTPLLGLGYIWAIAWSIKLYKSGNKVAEDEENPLIPPEDS